MNTTGIPEGGTLPLSSRRGKHHDVNALLKSGKFTVAPVMLEALEKSDLIYRAMCAILFNFVPNSGHPGGSISSGRIMQSLIFSSMDYDFNNPDANGADILSYAAGHKAMGLYAGWALRNEIIKISHPELLPSEKFQLRLEDLLGFRRNPVNGTPLFNKFKAKPLDGHPAPSTPFVKLSTGASGVGVASSFGLAFGAMDTYGHAHSPSVHVIEGEGGMTPGRVAESLATAATAQLNNLVMHLDWNQASIDSNRVCREGDQAGDYVQWTPAELFYLNDWNVITVDDGFDFNKILAAQSYALMRSNHQPTGIVYRTTKGWKYGVEGRASHGAGHAFCSDAFYASLSEFEKTFNVTFPRFNGDKAPEAVEQTFYDCLMVIRKTLEAEKKTTSVLGDSILSSKKRLAAKKLAPRADGPNLAALYSDTSLSADRVPEELAIKPGQSVTLRAVLGDIASFINKKTNGAILGASADLLESTSLSHVNKGFAPGFYNASANPKSRILAVGGICEDGMGGILAGVSSYGNHIGMGSSYGAFIAALQHVPARLHAIGQQNREHTYGDPQKPMIIVCAHAGPKTGEDGPTHADPQALQLFQNNFPKGSMITLTPWDAQEIWPLMITALKSRPAVIAPFVTRPAEPVLDRVKIGLPPASEAAKGIYAVRKAPAGKKSGTIVLQGNGVATIFITEVLPELEKRGINLNVYYVASSELFDLLPFDEQKRIFPDSCANNAMGITEFTLSTMFRWVGSHEGRRRTLHPFSLGHFLGSGQASKVFEEAQLDAKGQLTAVLDYAKSLELT
ncbi:MAG TPA: hypothetical protein DCS07_17930 [Bdellovibrionales bacterium]|nr:MAG: hypothetical protein A2Z97_10270 [Bdellovibrionales bacterium GWB1_52_6]OFZ05302.1 MAG: hypothetical protein A2X97_10980 [Bdellovibrionales bacterium GWA1_52_35]OFZ43516.1 MAG: hypothetical protein A2070_14260 [Bdellovibrionales bacterium GWC1_52_8]HAR44481.1 hypothetical protein [Bdellovibrionales bacterium]HCM38558.1 hypothetical protein [Bdellovibrionales bacterium]